MNKLISIFLILLFQYCTFPKDKTNEKNFISLLAIRSSIIRSSASGSNDPNQFTPNQANWNTFSTKPIAAGNTGHDPDSITWITKADWDAARWDGTTIYDPTKMTQAQFTAAICPSGDRIRGIREVFYRTNPFKDNKNPTKAEVDEWHRIALNHIRALVGYTSADRQIQKDHCMFKRALWGDERQNTRMWDARYPGVDGSAAGPCVGGTNAHCGASFIPSAADQAPYFNGTVRLTPNAEQFF